MPSTPFRPGVFNASPNGMVGFGGINTANPVPNQGWLDDRAATKDQSDLMAQQQGFQGQQSLLDRLFQGQQADAQRTFQGNQANADRGLQQQQAAAQHDWQTQLLGQQQGFQGTQADLQRTFQGTQSQLDRTQQTSLLGQQQGFQGQQSALDRDFQGGQAAAQRDFQGTQNAADRSLQQTLGLAPIDFQREKFNQVFPFVQSILGGAGGVGGSFGTNFDRVGGQNTPQPGITTGPVWNPQQVNQQVNGAKANNAQQAGTQMQQARQQTAGRGFGGRSPLLAALQGQIQANQMGQDATAERGIRWNAAEGNARQQLSSEQAREQAWADYNDADVRRRQAAVSGQTGLLSALTGLI